MIVNHEWAIRHIDRGTMVGMTGGVIGSMTDGDGMTRQFGGRLGVTWGCRCWGKDRKLLVFPTAKSPSDPQIAQAYRLKGDFGNN